MGKYVCLSFSAGFSKSKKPNYTYTVILSVSQPRAVSLFNDPAYLYTITDKLFTPVLFVFDLLNTVRLYSIQNCFYISYLNRRIVNITLPDLYRVLLASYCVLKIQTI